MNKTHTLVYLDEYRRVTIYTEGGMAQEIFVAGIGWIVADDREWNIDMYAVSTIREAAKLIRSKCKK